MRSGNPRRCHTSRLPSEVEMCEMKEREREREREKEREKERKREEKNTGSKDS